MAYTTVHLDLRSPPNPRAVLDRGNDTFAEGDLAVGSTSGAAYANLATGVLKASGVAPLHNDLAIAQGLIEDTISFSSGASGAAFLDWSLTGSLSSYVRGPDTEAELDVSIGGTKYAFILNNYNCDFSDFTGAAPTSCTVGTEIDVVGSLPISIGAGTTDVEAALVLAGGETGSDTFEGVARLYLRTSTGVTFSSGTGQFLANAEPLISAVPEPEAYALLLMGAAMMPLAHRRRKRHDAGFRARAGR